MNEPGVLEPDALSEFAVSQAGYIDGYIALADSKAVASFGISAAVLGYLLAQDWVLPLIKKGDVTHIEFLSTAAAVLILLLAGLLALVVLIPRRRRTGTGGVVSWTAISSYPSASVYLATLVTHNSEELAAARVAHCYDIARVCWRKQKWVGRSLLASGAGSLLSVFCVLLNA